MFWNLMGYGWPLLLSLLATPFIVTRLGDQLFGIYVLSGFVLSYFAFVEFGLGAAATKYISQYLAEDNREGIVDSFWACLAWFGGASLASVLLVTSLAHVLVSGPLGIPLQLQAPAAAALRISALMFAFALGCSLTTGTLRSLGRFPALNAASIVVGTAQTVLSVGLLWLGYSLNEVMIAQCLCHAALFAWQFALCLRVFPALRVPHTSPPALWRLLRYGSGLTGLSLTGPLLAHLEKVFLTRFASVGLLTYYAIPFSLVDRLGMIPSSFGAVLFPSYSYHSVKGREVNCDLHYQGTLYICVTYGFFASFLVILGEPFLTAWLGAEFGRRSAPILAILAVAGTLSAMARPAVTALQGIGRQNLPLLFHVAESLLYVPAAYYGVKAYGMYGAAWAWSLRVAVDAVLLHVASAVALGQPAGAYLRLLKAGSLPLAACSAAFWAVRTSGMPLTGSPALLALCVTVSGYGLLVWKTVLDGDTKERIISSWSRGKASSRRDD